MKLNKQGFTLTELLIALGVIGILAAVLMPIIINLLPDQNALMAKRAYYATQTIVSDLINYDSCYPDKTNLTDEDEQRVGFDDGYPTATCPNWTITSSDYGSDGKLKEGKANQKFVTLFKELLDIKQEKGQSFKTKDGISWKIDDTEGTHSFSKKKNNANDAYIDIYVDVNGEEKPNRIQGNKEVTIFENKSTADTDATKDFDTFVMRVYANGKIEIDPDVEDSWAREAVDVSKDVVGK